MTYEELVIGIVLGMPDIVRSILYIRCTLLYRVFVIPVETGFVDQINDGFLGIRNRQRRVGSAHLSVSLHL